MKLNIKAFAMACGLMWGIGLFIVTWWVILFEGQAGDILPIGYIYRGYCVSTAGSFIGLAWGFFDGIIAGAVFAWLYNLLSSKCAETKEAKE